MAATEREAPVDGGHLIKRPRLTRMLDESKARIILLVAPAGYGKTTLAREWLEGKPHIWYRASSADADVAALAVGLASAAAEFVPGADRRVRQRVKAARDPEEEASVLAELVADDLGPRKESIWLAIDDYQFVSASPAAERFVANVLDAVPWSFLATSRTRPSWAKARGVVYGGVTMLGRDELEMTEGEVQEAVGRTRTEVPTFFDTATGWPAIVGLAARVGPARLEGHDLPSDLHDFFAEELWQFLDNETRWHLAQLALIAPVSKAVAERIVGDDAANLFEQTTQAGWLTRDRTEVVIHPLLAQFLRHRFKRYPIRSRHEVVARLIRILAADEQWDQAMGLAFEADQAAVPSVLEKSLEGLLGSGRLPTIERWLQTARERHIKSPVLSLAAAEVSFRRGDYERAETLALSAASPPVSTTIRVRSLNAAGKSARWNERSQLALELHREARQMAPDAPSLREAIIGEILASLDVGLRTGSDLLAQLPVDEGSGLDRVRRATVEANLALHLGRAQDASAVTAPIMALLDDIDDPLARTSFLFTRALALNAGANYRGGLEVIAALERDATEFRMAFVVPLAKFARASSEAGLRNFSRARHLVRELITRAEGAADVFTLTNAAALEARIAMSDGSHSIPPLRAGLEDQSNVWVYGEYAESRALAEAAFGDPQQARELRDSCADRYVTTEAEVLRGWVDATLCPSDADVVSRALELSLERGFVDSFVVAYRGSPALIETLVGEPRYREYLADVLVRANDFELAARMGLTAFGKKATRHRITPREREVYSLMVEGLSNRSIARRLFITEATAKLHVRHILEKLSARSRAEAVAKWRDVLDDR